VNGPTNLAHADKRARRAGESVVEELLAQQVTVPPAGGGGNRERPNRFRAWPNSSGAVLDQDSRRARDPLP